MEESVAGFKERGTWDDIVEHGERLTRALKDIRDREDVHIDESALAEWDEWRPKIDERLDVDVNQKTADQASVGEGKGEQAGKNPEDDIQTAGEKLSESYQRLDEPDEAIDRWGESIDYVARAADSAGRRALRTLEDTVYRNVMTRISPYYFDNDLVSANIQRVNGGDDPVYALEVDINDDDLKIHVSNQLADYEQSVARWHVDAPKETETVEAVEGVDAPTPETDGRSKHSTN